MQVHRHWGRGILAGLFLGLAFALGSVVYSFNALGPLTPWVLFVVGLLIGLIVIFIPSRKARQARATGPFRPY